MAAPQRYVEPSRTKGAIVTMADGKVLCRGTYGDVLAVVRFHWPNGVSITADGQVIHEDEVVAKIRSFDHVS